ncbi:hypothetical protein ALI144C_07060 [Actinosynnema sp. ALI-1.44]|uniref:hypothetical protein n=1 Tax=Actinosynnema sp. ALI-1.44 TaxID=1933779 RepID=UPI00097C0348|nr:hypothetical protein [Actinosynnema sp. ALI-1.44]ONI88203.1 hypothetical protein ALI144C_07060 [Actinosynnema sp. ALI-1.44]
MRIDPARWGTAIMAVVVGLTFVFGFGNVLDLALREAPMVQLRPARRLLVFASLVTLALNVAEPLISGHIGRALFDAVGPLLLIGWAEVGPGLLQAIHATSDQAYKQILPVAQNSRRW